MKYLTLSFVMGHQYLGTYVGKKYRIKAWVRPQVEKWNKGVQVLAKVTA